MDSLPQSRSARKRGASQSSLGLPGQGPLETIDRFLRSDRIAATISMATISMATASKATVSTATDRPPAASPRIQSAARYAAASVSSAAAPIASKA